MDFDTFRKNRNTQKPVQDEAKDDIRKTAERYSGKSDAELLGEIVNAAKKEKQDGTYSDDKIDDFVRAVTPMLNAEQRDRLEKAIKLIKKD
ncbi:MAG: hypothetical protein J5765_03775 [Clostridia bacterium]|nr:hypothetical protein [Clostridia bacterium]